MKSAPSTTCIASPFRGITLDKQVTNPNIVVYDCTSFLMREQTVSLLDQLDQVGAAFIMASRE